MALNYQHLRYFWTVAREGSVSRAAKRLHLVPSTVSAQIHMLEEELGRQLLVRKGRGMVVTEHGAVVRRYADEIFAVGEELLDVVRAETGPRYTNRFRVGITNNLPKSVAQRLLTPTLHLPEHPVHLIIKEDHNEMLIADLSLHHLDLVVTDSPVGLAADVKLESIPLGGSGVSLMAGPQLAARHLLDFPASLDGAPLLLPDPRSAMRALVEQYLASAGIRPRVVAEFGDRALMKSFGRDGAGIFPVPSLVETEVATRFGVVCLGRLEGIEERFYAVLDPGRRSNPAVQAVLRDAENFFENNETTIQ
jgi:LysR family transcriptional regulator, transcriptional activator of nhaA